MGRRARSWHALLSRQGYERRRRHLQGLPRVTSAVAMSASGDRGEAEAIPVVRNPEVPRTDLLLGLSLHPFSAPSEDHHLSRSRLRAGWWVGLLPAAPRIDGGAGMRGTPRATVSPSLSPPFVAHPRREARHG